MSIKLLLIRLAESVNQCCNKKRKQIVKKGEENIEVKNNNWSKEQGETNKLQLKTETSDAERTRGAEKNVKKKRGWKRARNSRKIGLATAAEAETIRSFHGGLLF